MKKNISSLTTLVILAIVLMVVFVMPANSIMAQSTSTAASSGSGSTVTLQNPLNQAKYGTVGGLIEGFVEILSYIAVLFAVIVIIYIGFRFVLAQGNKDTMNELKDWLLWTVIGVAIVIGARVIIDVVINTLSATGVVNQTIIQSAKKANSGQ